MTRAAEKKQRKIDAIIRNRDSGIDRSNSRMLRSTVDRLTSEHPQRWGYTPKRKPIRDIVEDVVPDSVRKKFSTILITGDRKYYVERHGSIQRVDKLPPSQKMNAAAPA